VYKHVSLDYAGKYLFTFLTRHMYLLILKFFATPVSHRFYFESCRLCILEAVDNGSRKCDTGMWMSLRFVYSSFFISLVLYFNIYMCMLPLYPDDGYSLLEILLL
jgi:hypothetical protein